MNFKTKPRNHQLEAFSALKDLNCKGIFYDMGTGKTKISLDILRYKCYQQNEVLLTLIVAPKVSLENTWIPEIEKHTSLISYAEVLTGTSAVRRQKLKLRNKRIFIINYEGIATVLPTLLKMKWGMIIADESQRIGNHKSQRTKNMLLLSKIAKARFILTGTPILRSPMKIFSQALFTDHGKAFGTNFFAFRNYFFEDENISKARFIPREKYFPKYVLRKDRKAEYEARLSEFAIIKTKDECLDLPPKVFQRLDIEMGAEQLVVYKKMEKDLIALWESGEAMVAANAAVATIRLRQITSGFVVIDGPENKTIRFKQQPKLKALKTLLEDITPTAKVIVWACFRPDLLLLVETFKQYNPAQIFGGIKNTRAEQDKFNNDPSCRILIGNPQSAGVSLNLIAASYGVFYSQDFDPDNRIQGEDRCHRDGSQIHKNITYIDLICKNSVDEVVAESQKNKEDLSNNIIEVAKRLKRGRR